MKSLAAVLLAVVISVTLPLAGCAVVAGGVAGAGAAGVYAGQTTQYYPSAYAPTLTAVQTALARMQCVVLKTDREGADATVIHARQGHMLVDISVAQKGLQVTAVTSRFGILGSEKDDVIFHRYVQEALGQG
ncbi:MAG: DUF3568 family protein [Acidithiobacillus sp.]|uniref:DUF3568 family protein n=1 Tax=Acidithiobacillus sp. TaxID=1872118 RepID=UPI003D06BD24